MADKTLEAVIKLKDEMSKQLKDIQKTLDNFEDSATDTDTALKILEDTTKDAGKAIRDIKTETKATREALEDLGDTTEQLGDTTQEATKSIKGLALQEAGQKMTEFGAKILDVAANMLELTEETKEYNSLISKLEGASVEHGYSKGASKQSYNEAYKYLGDDMASVNVVTNLQGMGLSQKELDKTLQASIAVWTAYGDSIPIESLTESINETAQVGKVTGNLADALNWAGISEDKFNKKLEATNSVKERNKLITDALNGAYGESKKVYDEANGTLMAYNDSQRRTIEAQAELGESLAPLNSAIAELKVSLLESLAPAIQEIAKVIQPIIEKISQFVQENPELASTIALVVGALGGLLAIIGPIVTMGGMLLTVVGAPMILMFAKVAAIIAAVIAVGTLLVANWGKIKQGAIDSFNKCKEEAQMFKDAFLRVWEGIKNVATIFMEAIKTTVQTGCDTIKSLWQTVETTVGNAVEGAKTLAINAFNAIKDKVEDVVEGVKEKWNNLKDWFANNPITSTIKQVINKVTGQNEQSSAFGTRYVHGNDVPYRLHDGEAVLARRDADKWREGKGNGANVNITISNMVVSKESDIEDIASALVRKINQQRIITSR